MKKGQFIALASAVFLGFVTPSAIYAQEPGKTDPQSDAKPAAPPAKPEHAGPTDNQIANDVDAKIARLKADLRLTDAQETNWPLFESTLHDYGIAQFKKLVAQRNTHQERSDRPNDIAMMKAEADRLVARADSLKKLASAADPLYGTLDDHQRRRLAQFMSRAFAVE